MASSLHVCQGRLCLDESAVIWRQHDIPLRISIIFGPKSTDKSGLSLTWLRMASSYHLGQFMTIPETLQACSGQGGKVIGRSTGNNVYFARFTVSC